MTTRIMMTLVVAQTLAIVFLAYAFLGLDRDIESITAIGDQNPGSTRTVAPIQQAASIPTQYITEDQLRRIIAEEISAHLNAESRPDGQESLIVASDTTGTGGIIEAEDIEREIEYHISVGSISPSDMEALQARIAQLDRAGQQRMLRKLVKAMNDGLIDGRL